MRAPVWRARLEATPAGLTIPDADVDALLQYGEQLNRQHARILAIANAANATPSRLRSVQPSAQRDGGRLT